MAKWRLRLTIEIHPSALGEGQDFVTTIEGVPQGRLQLRQYVPANLFVSVYDQMLSRAAHELREMILLAETEVRNDMQPVPEGG